MTERTAVRLLLWMMQAFPDLGIQVYTSSGERWVTWDQKRGRYEVHRHGFMGTWDRVHSIWPGYAPSMRDLVDSITNNDEP